MSAQNDTGEFVGATSAKGLTLGSFEALLASIGTMRFESVERGRWRARHPDLDLRYGYVCASPCGDDLAIQVYGFDWELPERWATVPATVERGGETWQVLKPGGSLAPSVLRAVSEALAAAGAAQASHDGSPAENLDNTEPLARMPQQPEPPSDKTDLGAWWVWYDAMKGAGYQCTLEMIAKKTGYAVGTVKNKHAEWLAEHRRFET